MSRSQRWSPDGPRLISVGAGGHRRGRGQRCSGAFPGGYTAKADSAVNTLERFAGGRGKVVLTASDATQYSFEGNQLRGSGSASVFTRHLVDGLRTGEADQDGDGDIALDELYTYVYERVVAEMPQQRPKKQDDVEGRIVIARNIRWDLPGYVRSSLASPIPSDRLQALTNLARLHANGNPAVRARVIAQLTELADDDSKQVSQAATELLRRCAPMAGQDDAARRQAEEQQRREAEEAQQRRRAKQQRPRQATEKAIAGEAEEPPQASGAGLLDQSPRADSSGARQRWVASLVLLAGALAGFAAEFLIWNMSPSGTTYYKERFDIWLYYGRGPDTVVGWYSWPSWLAAFGAVVAAGVYASRRYGPYALGYLLGTVVLACPILIIQTHEIVTGASPRSGFWLALAGIALLAVGVPIGCRAERMVWHLTVRRDLRAVVGAGMVVIAAVALYFFAQDLAQYVFGDSPPWWLLLAFWTPPATFMAVALLQLDSPQRRMALTAVAVVATAMGAAAIRDTLDSSDYSPSLFNPLCAVAVSALGCVIAQARPAPHRPRGRTANT